MMFTADNFQVPMLLHDQPPPGVPAMKQHKKAISCDCENAARRAQLLITTKDKKAVKAIHAFLRFQISDHKTGDSTEISKDKP